MLFNILSFLINNFSFFSGAYSNSAFPEPLTKEEEELYINKMLKGDNNARSILIEHNLRLVAHIVKKYEANNNDRPMWNWIFSKRTPVRHSLV